LAAQGLAPAEQPPAAQGFSPAAHPAAHGFAEHGLSVAEHGLAARAGLAAATTRPVMATADPRTSMDFFNVRIDIPFLKA